MQIGSPPFGKFTPPAVVTVTIGKIKLPLKCACLSVWVFVCECVCVCVFGYLDVCVYAGIIKKSTTAQNQHQYISQNPSEATPQSNSPSHRYPHILYGDACSHIQHQPYRDGSRPGSPARHRQPLLLPGLGGVVSLAEFPIPISIHPPSTFIGMYRRLHLGLHPFIHPSIHPFIQPFLPFSLHLSLRLSINPSLFYSLPPSIPHPSLCPSRWFSPLFYKFLYKYIN